MSRQPVRSVSEPLRAIDANVLLRYLLSDVVVTLLLPNTIRGR